MTLWKGLKFFRAESPLESPKVMGLMGIHDPDILCHFNGVSYSPWCRKVDQNDCSSSITCEQCITNWTLCVKNVLAAHPLHGRPFATTARRAAYHQKREIRTSHLHQHNY